MVGAPSAGRRQFGVPPGGAADRESQLLANTLLGRAAFEQVLEIPLMGGEWIAEKPTVVSVVGAQCPVTVDGKSLPCQSRFGLREGQRLTLGPCTYGARVYLACREEIFLSKSGTSRRTEEPSSGRPAPRGIGLLRLANDPSSLGRNTWPPRCVRGPQGSEEEFERFLLATWTVSPVSDRRGVRMMEKLEKAPEELPSEPACVGAVQITADGTPIVFGVDGPTIGGYPKIAVVAEADHDRIGQMAPGESVRFDSCSLGVARGFSELREQRLSDLVRGIIVSLRSAQA